MALKHDLIKPLLPDPLSEVHLPSSVETRRAWANIGAALAVAAGVATLTAALPRRVMDPWALGAGMYVYGLFCFQNAWLEWTELVGGIRPLLALAAATSVAPTALETCGLWQESKWRWLARAGAGALLVAGYQILVRGPASHLRAGSLQRRIYVVTGCNTGIGYETAESLARAGGSVVFACRSEARARDAMRRLLRRTLRAGVTEDQLQFFPLDLASHASVRRFVQLLRQAAVKVDVLVLNAGVMISSRCLSEDGLELTLASNHFGHFLLTHLLLPDFLSDEAKGGQPRIVVVSSNTAFMHGCFDFNQAVAVKDEHGRNSFLSKPYRLVRAYAQSKLANVLFTAELSRRLRRHGSRIPVVCVHPGQVATEVHRDMHPVIVWLAGLFRPLCWTWLKTARQGSACTVYAATAASLAVDDRPAGAYYARLRPTPMPEAGQSEAAAARLWAISEDVTGVSPVV